MVELVCWLALLVSHTWLCVVEVCLRAMLLGAHCFSAGQRAISSMGHEHPRRRCISCSLRRESWHSLPCLNDIRLHYGFSHARTREHTYCPMSHLPVQQDHIDVVNVVCVVLVKPIDILKHHHP